MSRRRLQVGAVAAGAVVVAAYLVAASITLRVSGRQARPLYDGIASTFTYEWICPPASLKAVNTTPNRAQLAIDLTGAGSANITVATDDSQILFSMAQGEIPARGTDTAVLAKITPLCATKLGAVPAGYSPAGNAYRYTLTYQPSGVAVTATAKPGDVLIRPPTSAHALAYSADNGKTWRLLQTFHSQSSIGASFTNPGIYLALQRGNGGGLSTGSSGGSGSTPFIIGLVVAVVAAGIVAAVEIIRRRR